MWELYGSSKELWATWSCLPVGDGCYANHKKAYDACCLFGEELEVDYAT